MKTHRSLLNCALGAVAVGALTLGYCLWVVLGASGEAKADNTQPVAESVWVLPDGDPTARGSQVLPLPGGATQITCWVVVAGNVGPTGGLWVRLHYPDGSVKLMVLAEEAADSAADSARTLALAAGLISAEESTDIREGRRTLYLATGQLLWHDPAGHYDAEVWFGDQADENARRTRNTFEYYGLVAFETDFVELNFGLASAGQQRTITGDSDMASPDHPTVINLGNEPAVLEINASPLVGQASGDEITDFRGQFGGQQLRFRAGERIEFDQAFAPGQASQLDIAIDVPAGIRPDKFKGLIFLASSSLFGPAVEIVQPGDGDIWHPGETHEIIWETTNLKGVESVADIWLSLDGGNRWSFLVARGVPNTGSYQWTIPVAAGIISENADIRVIAHDGDGTSGYDVSDGFFSLRTAERLSIDPEDALLHSGQIQPYTVTAYDLEGNGWDVSDLATFQTTDPLGQFAGYVYVAGQSGVWIQTATYEGLAAATSVQVAAPLKLTLAPWSGDPGPLDQTFALVASLTAGNNDPVPNHTVYFTVLNGPHAGVSGSQNTDRQGKAIWGYPGGEMPGTDIIVATSNGTTSNEVLKTWDEGPDPAKSIPSLYGWQALVAVAMLPMVAILILWRRTSQPLSVR